MKQIKLTFLFSVLMSMIGLNTFAHDIEAANTDGKTIYYNWINDNTELAVTFRGNTEDEYDNEYTGVLNIPQSVVLNEVTYPVTAIGDMAFALNTGLTSVNIPDGVTSIGMVAFYGCTALSSFNMPKSLTSVIFTDNLFYECYNLTSIEVAEENPVYDSRDNCNAIIMTATNTLMWGCKSSTIPNGITSIESSAFAYSSGLTSITIPSSVVSIKSSAFKYCPDLTSIEVAEGNTIYDSRDNCNAIIETASNTLVVGCKSSTFPNTVTSIGVDAFNGCTGLTSLYLGGGITAVGQRAFANCTGLTSLTVSSKVTDIQRIAFSYCSGLTNIVVEEGNTKYDSRENCNAVIQKADNTLALGCKNTIIPNSVTAIGKDAFAGCTEMTTINIPNTVTLINSEAFFDCTSLSSVNLPDNLKTIGKHAFRDCTSLTSITIPKSVESILENAFYNCYNLKSVISKIEEPKDILTNVFGVNSYFGYPDIYSNATLYVPAGTIEKYKAKTGWKEFLNIKDTEPSGIKSIMQGDDATEKDFYSLDGKQLNEPQHGLNIIRMSDGKTRKVMVK